MRWPIFIVSLLFAVIGVLSFLAPVPAVVPAVLLIAGAAGLAWSTWF